MITTILIIAGLGMQIEGKNAIRTDYTGELILNNKVQHRMKLTLNIGAVACYIGAIAFLMGVLPCSIR